MEDKVNYSELYSLQDRVMDAVFSEEKNFYLTGGTCINRFYNEKRYSDDLDFFTCDNNLFRQMIRTVFQKFEETGISFNVTVDSRDFVRILAENILKTDFINDRTFYYKKTVNNENGYVLDNPFNMLANKICTVTGRDEPKDIFDLFILSVCTEFNWGNIIDAALKKSFIDPEILEYRLKTFPLDMLEKLALKDIGFLTIVKKNYMKMVNDIINRENNSLFNRTGA